MVKLVVDGAQLKCSEGSGPGALTIPKSLATSEEHPAATIADHLPMVNVPSFGMCKTQANPQVASATAAAQGVLTPVPCVPATSSPWSPGSSIVTVDGVPAVTNTCTCTCNWTGVIEVVDAGTFVDVE